MISDALQPAILDIAARQSAVGQSGDDAALATSGGLRRLAVTVNADVAEAVKQTAELTGFTCIGLPRRP